MKLLKSKKAQLAALSLSSIGSAMAAVPADVTTAMTDAKADVLTIGGAVLLVIVAIAGFRYMKRAF